MDAVRLERVAARVPVCFDTRDRGRHVGKLQPHDVVQVAWADDLRTVGALGTASQGWWHWGEGR